MATFECNRCRRVMELDDDDPLAKARAIDCRCGGKLFRQFEDTSNAMRDMDNELGRDE